MCVSVSVCLSVCLSVIKIPAGRNLDAVLANWLLTALARTLLELLTMVESQDHSDAISIFFFIFIC